MDLRVSQATLDKILLGLSDPQRKAVTTSSRYVRIMASAGAGKTETLTRRIVYLIAGGTRPDRTVAFTFTEKAAVSMKERIYRRVREILSEETSKTLGEMFIGTMHSYAVRVLQDYFGFGDYEVLDENQEVAFLLQQGWGLGFGDLARAARSNYGNYCLCFLRSQAVVCDEMLDLAQVAASAGGKSFADQVGRYWHLLDMHRLLTFSHMIRLCGEHLARNPDVLQVEHLIVDEYQDINRAQESLISAIIDRRELRGCMVVGDPRQCIYEWRGSDPGCFERFASARPAETRELLENRRSGSQIVRVDPSTAPPTLVSDHLPLLRVLRPSPQRSSYLEAQSARKRMLQSPWCSHPEVRWRARCEAGIGGNPLIYTTDLLLSPPRPTACFRTWAATTPTALGDEAEEVHHTHSSHPG